MKNSWLIWIFIVAVIITVFIAFNYESGKQVAPLAEIFPEESTPVDVEYEFADQNTQVATPTVAAKTTTAAPVVTVASKEVIAQPAAQQQAAKQKTAPATQKIAQATTPTPTPTVAKASLSENTSSIPFTIQIASYKQKDLADDLASDLKAKNYESFVGSRTIADKGTYYRVYVGKFDSKQDAETLLAEIQKQYSNSFIITPKN